MFCVDWFSRIGVVLDGAEFSGAEGRCRLGSGRRDSEWYGRVVQAWIGSGRRGIEWLGTVVQEKILERFGLVWQ